MDVSARARSRARDPRGKIDFQAEGRVALFASYGVRVPTKFLRAPAARAGRDVQELVLKALS